MKEVLTFLTDLSRNNNREWFESNRSRYTAAKAQFEAFVEELIVALGSVDAALGGLHVKDCTYRIYRDTRFSPDKTPYKTHMGAYICPHGKKSGYAGYYFHIEPSGSHYLGHHLLSCGLYRPDATIVRSVRDEIVTNGEALQQAIQSATAYYLETEGGLKRLPAGYPTDTPYAEMLKLKDYLITCPVDQRFVTSPRLLERTVERFAQAASFVKLLNRAVEYAREGNL